MAEEEKLPRSGSILYNFTHSDEEIREKTLKKFRRLNKFLILPLYRARFLPLLGLGRIFLVLTTRGRMSGKKRRTPLEYHRIDGIITIFSGRGENSSWFKNLCANPESVWVRHGFHSFHARTEIVLNEREKREIFKWYVIKHSRSAKVLFGWDRKEDNPDSTDFSNLINSISIIRLYREMR
ncbi:MAG: nitroreductase family deazaflavin-dependent oxidoreductase [Promethearchaeota archaeon]|jgi:deazaflavin-dependent oxidoreductase (nitroreductase family)